jgi:catecholate siderophore receptor
MKRFTYCGTLSPTASLATVALSAVTLSTSNAQNAAPSEPLLPEIEIVAPPPAKPAAAKPKPKPAPVPTPAVVPAVIAPAAVGTNSNTQLSGDASGPGSDAPGNPGTGTTGIDGYTARATSTATKTNTAIMDIPQSITVITAQQAEDRGSETVAEALHYVPGVAVAQGEGHRDQISIRGQVTTADFFVDGVRDDVEYYRDLYNVDAIEVLKGPWPAPDRDTRD